MNEYDELVALERIVNSQLKELEKFEHSTSSDAAAEIVGELRDTLQDKAWSIKTAISYIV